MNLVIDIGNTRSKLCVFDGGAVVKDLACETFSLVELSWIKQSYPIDHCIISSVVQVPAEWESFVRGSFPDVTFFTHSVSIPLKNAYKTPETLGLDRLAAAVGARAMYHDSDILVIDAGTAITIDFVSKDGVYLGGNIAPGLSLRYRALNHFTNKLPLLEPVDSFAPFGTDTVSAITAGVQQGIVYEIQSYIYDFTQKYPGLKVIITGGDAFFFEKNLKNTIFVEPFLVQKGLNRILIYNAFEV